MALLATDCQLFQCYAHADNVAVRCLMRRLKQNLNASAVRRFQVWSDRQILIGSDWDGTIKDALARADAGLLLLSPSVLASDYVRRVELPELLGSDKVVPVGLRPIDFATQLPAEIGQLQIYRLETAAGKTLYYTECNGRQKDAFALGLYKALVARLEGRP
jgi:hypothetical protein